MSLAFLAKKSWHTANLKNQEKVWIAEQRHEAEEKKLQELRKQIAEERQMDEMREMQQAAGISKGKTQRLDWMYDGPAARAAASTDEYLLGKEYKGEGPSSDVAAVSEQPGALWLNKVSAANDTFTRLHEDPLLMIRKQQKDVREKILKNPVKMAKIRSQLEMSLKGEKKDKKKKDKKEKKEKKEKRKHKRDGDREDERRTKRSREAESSDERRPRRRRSKSMSPARERRDPSPTSRLRDRSRGRDKRSKRRSPSPAQHRRVERSRSRDRRTRRSKSRSMDRRRASRRSERSRSQESRLPAARTDGRGDRANDNHRVQQSGTQTGGREVRRKEEQPEGDSKPPSSNSDASGGNGTIKKYGLISGKKGSGENKPKSLGPSQELLEKARQKEAEEEQKRAALLQRQSKPLTEEEKKQRLLEMQRDAEISEARNSRLAASSWKHDDEERSKGDGGATNPNFLKAINKEVYMTGGINSMGDRISRNKYYLQKDTSESHLA